MKWYKKDSNISTKKNEFKLYKDCEKKMTALKKIVIGLNLKKILRNKIINM